MNMLDDKLLDQKSFAFLDLLGQRLTGTVIATMTPLTSGSITLANVFILSYLKIGRQIVVGGLLTVSAVSSPVGRLRIGGLPFASGKGNQFDSPAIIYTEGLTSNIALIGYVPNQQAFIDVFRLTTPTTDDAAAVVQANSNFRISVTYFIDHD